MIVVSILMVIYITTAAQSTRTSEFYTKTVAALDRKARVAKEAADSELKQRIADREKIAQVNAEPNEKHPTTAEKLNAITGEKGAAQQKPIIAPKKDDDVGDNEKSVAGRKMMKDDKYSEEGVAKIGNTEKSSGSTDQDETEEEHAVETELNSILKRSPSRLFNLVLIIDTTV